MYLTTGRQGGLMVCVMGSGSSGQGTSIMFLGRSLTVTLVVSLLTHAYKFMLELTK